MAHSLTERQATLLEYIKSCGDAVPSYIEMADFMGVNSKSNIYRLVCGLEERGHLKRLPGKARTIMLIDPNRDLSNVPTDALYAEIGRRSLEMNNDL